jgi:hypothetical protein
VRGRARSIFYIELLKMVSNTLIEDAISSCIPERLAKNAVRDARALHFKSF